MENIAAALADSFFGRNAGDFLGSSVKRSDFPVGIHREDPIGDGIQNYVSRIVTFSHGFKIQHRLQKCNPFSLSVSSDIVISIYNILGQEVTRVADGHFDAGVHSVEWNAGDKASGVYLYRIKAGDFVKTRKMVLHK